ncbi:MAG: type VI secretion system baseplate subunit TssF [Rhizobiales bacterium]|nr:type VI secretion system baseplate subunit TssF [Hyphomicrobiales bacterium]
MDERFVSYYEEELRFIRDMAGEFADSNQRTAGYLGLDALACEDPYVERLLEGFAFLAARVRLRQDTSFHRFTSHLLEMVYPGYLTPVPTVLIAQFEPDLTVGSLMEGDVVPRDTRLNAAPTPGVRPAAPSRPGTTSRSGRYASPMPPISAGRA